ncbi:hypothetical protein [Pontibacterium sp.]|uniref:hypothetical protein n=1 Tax=Pontibacterium sp. TaxID=2036026 RepID=UPI003511414D
MLLGGNLVVKGEIRSGVASLYSQIGHRLSESVMYKLAEQYSNAIRHFNGVGTAFIAEEARSQKRAQLRLEYN